MVTLGHCDKCAVIMCDVSNRSWEEVNGQTLYHLCRFYVNLKVFKTFKSSLKIFKSHILPQIAAFSEVGQVPCGLVMTVP